MYLVTLIVVALIVGGLGFSARGKLAARRAKAIEQRRREANIVAEREWQARFDRRGARPPEERRVD